MALHKHASQTDAAKGFGGKYGVQKDRQDQAAVDWSYKEKLTAHASQKGNSLECRFRGSSLVISQSWFPYGLENLEK